MATTSEHEQLHPQQEDWLWRPPAPPLPPLPEPFYVPGYEPSAPPEPLQEERGASSGEHLHEFYHPKPYPGLSEQPGGTRLVDILLNRFWRTSHTVLRLDLRRAIRLDGPIVHSRDSESPRSSYRRSPRGNRTGRTHDYPEDWETDSPSQSWLQGIHGGGAQLKLMQIWDFPDKETSLPSLPWNLNFGLGAKVEMDRGGRLEPQMRLRTKHLALYMLPLPLLELRGKWPLGGTRLAINVRYRVPLLDLDQFWESPTAQLCVNLYNPLGTGFHLSPGGLEFDEHVVNIGRNTKLRIAASVDFPRQFPLEEGEQPIRVHINRLGIKTRIS